MSYDSVSIPTVGIVSGRTRKEGVLQFLGLQYATLADRFAPAAMKEYPEDAVINATELGPEVLSLAPGPSGEFRLLQHTLDYDRSRVWVSETEGLCLNITVPNGALYTATKLPVFAFIHGGGFNVGSGMYPQYDMARFVRLSVREGMPCIAVTMNYRLGAPGFLTSTPLRKAGYKPNNTLRDQRTALLWLQKHIAGFGGDPDDITLAGESAGGISVCYHLFSEKPLFRRAVAMSGTHLLMPPITFEEAEKNYERAVKVLGLADGEGAVKGLLKEEGKEIFGKLAGAGIAIAPVIDDDIVPSSWNFESIMSGKTKPPGAQWCEAIILGDCQFDGNIQGLRLMHRKKGIAAQFCSAISKALADNPTTEERILDAYGLTPETKDPEAFHKVLQVANDLNFYLPTLALAQDLSSRQMKTYVYRFNEPNPWDGAWKGHATHILDLTFLLQNFNDFLAAPQRAMAEGFAVDVIGFVNGRAPWREWRLEAREAKALGPEGRVDVVEDVAEKVGRRSIMLELGEEVGVDRLNAAFQMFMNAAPPPV